MIILSHAEIKGVLPHRYPMLLVDTVKSLEPGIRIVATKNVTGNEPCFAALADWAGPKQYAYPRTLILESFGQAAGIIFAIGQQQSKPPSREVLFFGAATRCRFHEDVFPGDTMEHRASLDRRLSDTAVFSGEVWVGDRRVVEIERIIMALRPAKLLDQSTIKNKRQGNQPAVEPRSF